ncbi:ATP-binding domain-containing protein [Streptomyces sp. NPDC001380]|uniref:ATP-binding domain-containing protein n=1 Tax=Streptomyces sp. NPDC001380 TaxID=3364566 RepID=UPI0036AECC83
MSDEETSAPEGRPERAGQPERAGAPAEADGAGGPGAAAARPDTARLAEAIRAMGRGGQAPAAPGERPAGPGAGAEAGAGPAAVGGAGAGGRAAPADEQREEALRAASEVLAAGGAPVELAPAAVAALGDGAAEALREDPWTVLALPGVRPEQADGFARGLLGPAAGPGDPRRAQALAVWLLERAALHGHTALEVAEVRAELEKLGVPDPETALGAVVTDGRVMAFQDEDLSASPGGRPTADDEEDEGPPVRMLLALDRLALAEESLADGLVRLMSTFDPYGEAPEEDADTAGTDTADAGAADDEGTADGDTDGGPGAEEGAEAGGPGPRPGPPAWEAAAAAAPSPSAAALVRAAAESGLVLHTGGEAARAEPAALVAAARGLGLRAWAAAWTAEGAAALGALADRAGGGRSAAEAPGAAQDAGSAEGAADAAPVGAPDPGEGLPGEEAGGRERPSSPAAAVTLAGLLSGTEGPGREADGSLALDLLVVCDAPLLDVETAATLAESLADGTRLVLSGDPGQLWSAGPGRVFADLLAAKACPAVASRTPDFGPIGELVSGIGVGELQPVEAPGREVVIVPAKDGGEAAHRAVQLVVDSIPRALGIPAGEVAVLTPGHGGGAGTRALNAALKTRLNPGPGRFGGFDPGDRVVHSPAPGSSVPGTVVSADAAGLHLDLDGRRTTVPRERVAELRHGWALSVHQAVGRRWPAVVAVLPDDAAGALTRQLVYTAFGRAERHLSVVHAAGQALPQAVASVPARPRTTRLRGILAGQ